MAIPVAVKSPIEARTIRKLRRHIIPFVFVLFIIAVVDRNNIGFAALTMIGPYAIGANWQENRKLPRRACLCGFFVVRICTADTRTATKGWAGDPEPIATAQKS